MRTPGLQVPERQLNPKVLLTLATPASSHGYLLFVERAENKLSLYLRFRRAETVLPDRPNWVRVPVGELGVPSKWGCRALPRAFSSNTWSPLQLVGYWV